jgi:hypothetical protein
MFNNEKYSIQNVVLSEEKLDETGVRLEQSSSKPLTWLAEQAQVLYENNMGTSCKTKSYAL